MTEIIKGVPAYTGMFQYRCEEGGFSIWLPTDWHKYDLDGERVGAIFSPYADDINTSLYFEKHNLKVKVREEDMDILREGFTQGIQALPGVEILSQTESIGSLISVFEATYTFMDGDVRRKRWAKNIYWGRAQLVMIAQGRTPENYDYWKPMFYNAMVNTKIM